VTNEEKKWHAHDGYSIVPVRPLKKSPESLDDLVSTRMEMWSNFGRPDHLWVTQGEAIKILRGQLVKQVSWAKSNQRCISRAYHTSPADRADRMAYHRDLESCAVAGIALLDEFA